MIKTFGGKETEKLFQKEFVAKFQKIAKVAYRKLKINKPKKCIMSKKKKKNS